VGVASVVVVGALLAPGAACTPHNCDPTTSTFDFAKQGIKTVEADGTVILSSGVFDDTWLDYPGGITIDVTYPSGFVPSPSIAPVVWVSTGQKQDASATATSASGSLDQLTNVTQTGFDLNNGSCAEYYVWFSVTGTMPASGDAGARD
jgi:hypothetical protein